jgi:phosphatidylinositol-4,5-bisphosphate 3-kinase
MVQCLKFEPYHDSPLSRFLVERAVQNPYQIGHALYWHLKAELHDPMVCERFSVILELMLSHVGIFADELQKQVCVVKHMQKVAELIVQLKRELQYTNEEAMKEYTKELEKLNKTVFEPMGKFQLPLNPKIEATSLIVEKCRFMSSKMVPLWLVFKNADEHGGPIYVIFKSGDDLRQDLLTLQLLRVMDRLWLQQGLDMRLKPYSVIATGVNDEGEGVGMIEVVMNSATTSDIQREYGGGAMGALKLSPIDLFIREHNKDGKAHIRAVDNFVRSCAGYCVATFVLGIGDRHNGNIMVTKSGHLFHIDFGHFLGNFKKKFGVNRERAAFVFTPEMAYVMGGKDYKKHTLFNDFKKLCSKSFKVLRVNAGLLENLFILMVAAGMPELMKETDICYLREKLHLDKDSKQANKELHDELKKSLDSTYRRIDNYIHNIRHG